ncbi:MAG: hypothetical protein Q8K63_15260 [Acidimicrobiales bacterium]|nr:hypothetical protein [Acidimicrobiales bacterium]
MRLPISDPWSPVETRQRVEAPRDDVFNLLADPRTYPDWLVGAQRIRDVDDEFPAEGTKFEHSVGPTEATTVDDNTEVIETHGHRQLMLEVHAGPFKGEVEFDLRKRGEATEVVMREKPIGPAALLTPFIRPILALRNQRSMRQLAYIAQGRTA